VIGKQSPVPADQPRRPTSLKCLFFSGRRRPVVAAGRHSPACGSP